ncbi:hypothetical protein TEA_008325 [Camellia sinensis var. sinensis]|uniref:Glycosyltransferase N-terminal domain-containing protein n=1 Tax=Camellia sinensis var. sinensis TaxID=542762 RepID=A0A4S4ESE4_CAMSN|nr:hypothetical protein TEA_008325 [Camellia sinensis var. sinensis]
MAVGDNKPHAVCIPYPAQSHIKGILKLAKLLHHKGFYITFVNTEFNQKRLIKARGYDSLYGLPNFQFKTIPDGLPPSNPDATQDIPSLCRSIRKNFLTPFRNLLASLNDSSISNNHPPVTCIVSDGVLSFTITAAQELGIPVAVFWTFAACGFMGFYQYRALLEKGLTPLKAMACTSLVKLNASSSQWISWQSFNQRPGSSCRFASPRVSIVRAESYSDELVKTAVSSKYASLS